MPTAPREKLIPIIDLGETETDWVMVMPRAETSLEDHLAARPVLDQPEAIGILIDIALALESRQGRVVHRDIKPGNVLLYQDHWCLADFGISRYAEATTDPATRKFSLTSLCRTGAVASRASDRRDRRLCARIVAFEILNGRLPFEGPGTEDWRRAAPPWRHPAHSPAFRPHWRR